MTILITGADGYLGWPISLRVAKEFHEHRVVLIDNFSRRQWVAECGSVSAVPIQDMEERMRIARKKYPNMSFVRGDLSDKKFVDYVIGLYKPEVIVHTAAQPSAPYSQINSERANFTQENNNKMCRFLLWAIKENNLKAHFIETTTTGVYGAPEFPIPEGFVDISYDGGTDNLPTPSMGGSWYHMSKCHDVGNMWLAQKQWGIPITDLRTAIVYGTETGETKELSLPTRFDFDFYFGVVGNRFCAQAVAGYPLTIYGKGEQRKPMVSLEDVVESTVNAIRAGNAGKFLVYNQCHSAVSIIGLATSIQRIAKEFGINVEIKHMPNPRKEKEEHKMVIENSGFLSLLKKKPMPLDEGIRQTLETLIKNKDVVVGHKDRFLPSEILRSAGN